MSTTTTLKGPLADPQERKKEQFGWMMFDWAWSTFVTTVLAVFLGPYLTSIAKEAASATADGRINVLIATMRPESFYPMVVTVATLVSLPLMLVIGAVADRSSNKKAMLALFSFSAAIATMSLYFVTGGNYVLGGLLTIVASVSYQCAGVVYNSFLPDVATLEERDRVSSKGWAFGYASGALMLIVNLAMVLVLPDAIGISEDLAVRIALVSAGLWWALWMIVPLKRLLNRVPDEPMSVGPAVKASFGQLAHTARGASRYKMTLLFLLAFLCYKDGIATVFSLAATFATEELKLTTTSVLIATLIINIVGIGGALMMSKIADRTSTKRSITMGLVVWVIVCVYAYFVPEGSPVAFYAMAFMIALVIGGTQALSRSLYSKLIPKDQEAEYFALYGLGAQGTAWIGTLTFTLVLEATGSYRAAIAILIVFFVAGGLLLSRVDVERGEREAGQTADEREAAGV